MSTWQNILGTWKSGNWWVNVGGTWKRAQVYQNVQGVWKNLSTVFTPDGGNVSDDSLTFSSVTLSCTTDATWTYTQTLGGAGSGVSRASGTTGPTISFTLSANTTPRAARWTVTGVSNGITRNFVVDLTCEGSGTPQ